jgi:nitrous oxidase accessory protein NosD
MRRRLSLTVSVVTALAIPLTLARPASASTTHVVQPGESIQAAINRATPGDTIQVKPGTYRENLEIAKNGITLVGPGATLKPPAKPRPSFCDDDGTVTGICVHGDVDADFNPTRFVRNVTIRGLSVEGFSGTGVFAAASSNFKAQNAEFARNGGYGVFTLASKEMKYLGNRSHHNAEAGFYIGFSPEANALVQGNRSWANLEGLLFGHARHGIVTENTFTDNCAGILILNAGALGPQGKVGNVVITKNQVIQNNRSCTAEDPPVSGLGIGLAGAVGNEVRNNDVRGNRPSGPTIISGGIVLLDTTPFGGAPPNNNHVAINRLNFNQPFDIDGRAGANNVFRMNRCTSSIPPGLCV